MAGYHSSKMPRTKTPHTKPGAKPAVGRQRQTRSLGIAMPNKGEQDGRRRTLGGRRAR